MAKTATHITVDGERYDLQDAELAQDVSDLKSALTDLETRLKSGDEEDAELHLGFYLDEDGDLCQVDDE